MATGAAAENINELATNGLDALKQNVIVTGFGPFDGHPINASWEAVRLLPQMNIDNELDLNLIVEQIPVKYDAINQRIPQLWSAYKPMLVIHVGVSSLASNLEIERCARLTGYTRCDIEGQRPECHKCCIGNEDLIYSSLDILGVSKKINSQKNIQTSVSTDAGRYLCEYVYYTSLSHDNSRSVFIHVPSLNKCAAEQTASGLKEIIKLFVEEVRLKQQQQKQQVL